MADTSVITKEDVEEAMKDVITSDKTGKTSANKS